MWYVMIYRDDDDLHGKSEIAGNWVIVSKGYRYYKTADKERGRLMDMGTGCLKYDMVFFPRQSADLQ